MHWLVFIIISVTAISVSALYQRLAMKEKSSDPVASSILFQIILTVCSFAVTVFTGFRMPDIHLWPQLLSAAALYAAGTYFLFRAVQVVEASEMTILGGFGTLTTIIVSFLFLSERLTVIQLAGALLIISAVILVKYERKKPSFTRNTAYALLGSACYGIAVVFDGYILRTYDSFSYVPVMSLFPAVILMLIFPKTLPGIVKGARSINKNLIIYSILYVFAAELFYIALDRGALVSQASTIMRASVIITVILAMVFLKERDNPWKKLFGAILTTAGILLIR